MRKIQRYGWIQDPPDHRDYKFAMLPMAPIVVPSSITLKDGCPPIYDQGDLGSCTANAIAAAVGFQRHKQGEFYLIPSRLFIYYEERNLEGTVGFDSGATLRDGLKVVSTIGVCSEHRWPYADANLTLKPRPDCYLAAALRKATTYHSISQDITQMKACLAAGFPFVFGFTVYSSFESQAVSRTGDVPMPGPNESILGGHAVLCMGYDDTTGRFKFRNSWGLNWGAEGYGTMPYEYLASSDLADDFWTIRMES